MSQERKGGRRDKQAPVPDIDVDIARQTGDDEAKAAARFLSRLRRRPRPAKRPRHRKGEQEEYHVGGVRGPQEPGPWGSDEAVRDEPPWGSSRASPMDEGSE